MLNYCAWCNKHINLLNFQKFFGVIDKEMKAAAWFCCPRCYLEFRRIYKGENFNVRFDPHKELKIGRW